MASGPSPVTNVTVEILRRLLQGKKSETAMTRLTWQEYFEQTIRVQLQNLAARQASGRQLIEQLRAVASDYKRVLFNDKSP
jgi:hypothetical protein